MKNENLEQVNIPKAETSKYKQMEEELRESKQYLSYILDSIQDGISILDADLQIVRVNSFMERYFSHRMPIVGRKCHEVYHLSAEPCDMCPALETLLSGKSCSKIYTRDENVWMELVTFPLFDPTRSCVTGVVEYVRNITERKRMEEELRESRQYLSDVIQFFPDATMVIDCKGKVVEWNLAMEKLSGVKSEDMLGKDNYEYALPFYGVRRPTLIDLVLQPVEAINKEYIYTEHNSNVLTGEAYFRNFRGEEIYMHGTASALRNTRGEIVGAIESIRNITDRKRAEEALREKEHRYYELSITDSLTGLYNSRHFYGQIQMEMNRAKRYQCSLSMMFLDVDNFKKFNDTFGHLEGDHVLSGLAQIIRNSIRQTDSAYRYGGEEFVILLPETDSSEAFPLAERLRSTFELEKFIPAGGGVVHMTVSIGISDYIPGEDAKEFIQRADDGTYTAKRQGKNRVVFCKNDESGSNHLR